MKINTTLQIGEFHTNYCEDFLVVAQIATKEKLIAVLDGCTMGTESVFASMLYGKVLRKIAKQFFYEEFYNSIEIPLEGKIKAILKELFKQTNLLKNQLGLDINELLSTMILGVVDTENSRADLITIGDGLIFWDGELIEYEQNNIPDYLGYHLSENFEEWFQAQNQKLTVENFKNLSISTDGIFTFKDLRKGGRQKPETEIINFLLVDEENSQYENFLDRKIRFLKNEMNQVVTDDLAIIRLMN
ncbi:protein phosphatase 2C domain-containing protein [Flexithrix dorotheae]|uniref:protein phosphatase 2C domain-containing protein n=1 Tax=Flexithrix dorotheae TaxID=70993 RepID=UPI0003736A23|nr:protein phosphatase 2C domain-containing protein [Flexithrix dorotheae]